MRVAIIGAGAVGGTFAARLAGSDHVVEVTARGEHLEAIREDGIRLRGGWGDIDARVEANEVLTARPDVAIVATKAQDAPAAIRANLAQLDGVPLLVVQNGVDGLQAAKQAAPGNPVFGGLAMFAASFLAPGEITVTAPGPTFVGGDGAFTVAMTLVELELIVVDDFPGAQWSKLVVNQVNALPAITGLSVQEVVGHRGLRRLLVRSMKECVRVGMAAGIRFAAISGLSHGLLRAFSVAPTVIAERLPLLMARRMGDVPNPGSTLQSIRRGRLTEVDQLNGAVVAAGGRHRVATPANALMVELVHEVERTGVFLTPEQVLARAAG